MKQLLINSYLAGNKNNIANFLNQNNVNTNEPILFIPTAGNVEAYTKYIDEGKAMLSSLGYQLDVLDIAAHSQSECLQKVEAAQAIVITGGNTFYLLQEIKNKNLILPLRKKIETGCPYIGESAGGFILAADIDYAKIMDDAGEAKQLTSTAALNEVSFFPLPHYIEAPFIESVQETFEQYYDQLNLVPINNHQSISVADEQYRIVDEAD